MRLRGEARSLLDVAEGSDHELVSAEGPLSAAMLRYASP